jgi:hypothetical protein
MPVRAPGAQLILFLSVLSLPGAMGETVTANGVDRYRVTGPMFECVRVVLAQRGEDVSPAYVQGISGAAFRLAGPCPCAPTCSAAMSPQELIGLFGYEAESMPLNAEGLDLEAEAPRLIARVKDEVRAGRPAIVWHAFTNAEWDVVCGFDDERGIFFGRGSYDAMRGEECASAPAGRTATCGDICPPQGAIFVGEKAGEFDAPAAELAALREAVRHGRTPEDRVPDGTEAGEWRFRNGIGVYDWWIENAPTGWDYCLDVTRSRHRAAAEFLAEIAPRHPAVEEPLRLAARQFAAEADALDRCTEAVTDEDAEQPQRKARAAELLALARDHYAAALDQLEAALAGAEPLTQEGALP